MPTTANYSWPTPADTDLVKDGAEAIRDLGNAVDTTVKAVSDGRGLVHINETTFSGVSSQSVNDVFSATYDNYKILMNITSSNDAALLMRLRVSGSDDTNTNYHNHWQQSGSDSTAYSGVSNASQSSFRIGSSGGATSIKSLSLDFFNPFLSERTMYLGIHNFSSANKANSYAGGIQQGAFNNSTSFTGFTIFPNTGTLTGTIRVYGYKN